MQNRERWERKLSRKERNLQREEQALMQCIAFHEYWLFHQDPDTWIRLVMRFGKFKDFLFKMNEIPSKAFHDTIDMYCLNEPEPRKI